jgi:Endonuclease NucS
MKRPNEGTIRDALLLDLSIVEPGLTPVAREHYLRNTSGASGFLDILARDSGGKLVIIEIKKTDAAAREAVQELFKYAALLRQNLLIRDVEYRMLLLSVEWHELLTPYSEFAINSPYAISAGKINLDENGSIAGVERLHPALPTAQRRFSNRQFLWRFESSESQEKGVKLLSAHMKRCGLTDFVLVRSQSNNEQIRDAHFIYFAQQQLRLEEYLSRIQTQVDPEEYAEFLTRIEDLAEEEDQISEAADQVWLDGYDELYGELDADHSEISHPEKASSWFAEDAQRNVRIERFGRFESSEIADQTIISELIGQDGSSDIHLNSTASTSSAPEVTALRAAIDNVFFFNPTWKSAVGDLLSYAIRSGPAEVSLQAFSNDDILRATAGMAFGYPGFAPTFRFDLRRQNETLERFIGLPEWDGTVLHFDRLMAAHFPGDKFDYFVECHFGAHRGKNLDIMADMGLTFAVFRETEDGPERIRVQGSIVVGSPRPIIGSLPSLIDYNVQEVHKLVALFMDHDAGFRRKITEWVNRGEQNAG